MNRQRSLVALLVVAPLLSTWGCAGAKGWLKPREVPSCQSFRCQYTIEGNLAAHQPAVAVTDPQTQATVLTAARSVAPADQYVRTLELLYHYPAGSDGCLAILRTARLKNCDVALAATWPGPDPSLWEHEVRTLKLSKQEVDSVLACLEKQGYFADEQVCQPGVNLCTMRDDASKCGPWQRVDALDLLAHRVMARGTTVNPAKLSAELVTVAAWPSNQPATNQAPATQSLPGAPELVPSRQTPPQLRGPIQLPPQVELLPPLQTRRLPPVGTATR